MLQSPTSSDANIFVNGYISINNIYIYMRRLYCLIVFGIMYRDKLKIYVYVNLVHYMSVKIKA